MQPVNQTIEISDGSDTQTPVVQIEDDIDTAHSVN